MNNKLCYVFALLFCGSILATSKKNTPLKVVAPAKKISTPDEILAIVDDYRSPSGSLTFRVRVKDFTAGKLQKETVYQVYSKNPEQVLIETLAPKRLTGRKLLMAGTLWLYLPTLRRPTQVGMQQRLTGEVNNGDIARTSFHRDYRARILGKEMVGQDSTVKLELTAKDESAPYRRIHLWVSENSYEPRRADFFALSGKPMKRGDYSEPETILGKRVFTKLLITDAVNPANKSLLKYFGYTRQNFSPSFFEKESLSE